MAERWEIRCDDHGASLVGPAIVPLAPVMVDAVRRAGRGEALDLSEVEAALRASARLVEASTRRSGEPAAVDLEIPTAALAAIPWEAAFPAGVPVVRRVPGARPVELPACAPLHVAVSPLATLPDAVLTAVFDGEDYAPVLVVRAWSSGRRDREGGGADPDGVDEGAASVRTASPGDDAAPAVRTLRADVVQLCAVELADPSALPTLLTALAAAGTRLVVLEAYTPADRALARRVAWSLVHAGLPAVLVLEDPSALTDRWFDLVHGRSLEAGLDAAFPSGRLTALPGGERPVPAALEPVRAPAPDTRGAGSPPAADVPPELAALHRHYLHSMAQSVGGQDHSRHIAWLRAMAGTDAHRGDRLHAASLREDGAEGPDPAPEAPAADPRVVNVWLDGSPTGPLVPDTPYDLLVDVGPPRRASTVADPPALPPEVLAAARQGGTELDILVTAAACDLDGVTPDGPRWASVARRLVLDERALSDILRVRVVPRFDGRGFVRVLVAWRNHVLQSLRVELWTSAAVDDADPCRPVVTRVEYAAAADLGRLADLPPRRVALTLNHVEDVHAVSVLADDGTTTRVASLTVRAAFFEQFVPAFRAAFEAAAVDPVTGAYAFHPGDNSGDRPRAERLLTLLATRGAYAFRTLFSRDAADLLRERLAGADETVQVAALADGEVVPWSFLYDLDLVDKPDRVCLTAVDAAPPGDALLPWTACRASPDCPLGRPGAERVVCPWGFWGVRHRVEQPPMRVDEAPTRDVVLSIPTGPVVRGVMGVSLAMHELQRHESEIAALPADFVVVGKDPGFGPDQVRRALEEIPAALLYFYCHGGVDDSFGITRPWLAFGRTLDERVHPDELRFWRITLARHPLVLVNGCGTARIEPAQLAEFVTEFARHGAAGVVGTETRVWEPLAREVAVRLLAALLERRSLGEALQRARHALLKKGNPLGLTYTAFASADLRLVPE